MKATEQKTPGRSVFQGQHQCEKPALLVVTGTTYGDEWSWICKCDMQLHTLTWLSFSTIWLSLHMAPLPHLLIHKFLISKRKRITKPACKGHEMIWDTRTLESAECGTTHHPAHGNVCQRQAVDWRPSSPRARWRMPHRREPWLISIALKAHAEVDQSVTELGNTAHTAWQPLC